MQEKGEMIVKHINLIIFLTVLFVPIYSYGIPGPPGSCPCSSEVIDDTTGTEILAEICPGGELAPNASLIFNQNEISVFISEPPRDFAAGFFGKGGSPACEVRLGAVGLINSISNQQLQVCRAIIAEACGLNTRSIPTLSEWGLIAMAGILGLVGTAVIRRKRAAA